MNEISDDRLQELRQLHEVFLDKLEALAVRAIATGDWDAVHQHIATMQPKRTLQDVLPVAEGDDAIAFISRLLEGKPLAQTNSPCAAGDTAGDGIGG